jgi:hypothetical protein
MRASSFRLEMLDVQPPVGPQAGRLLRAVAISEIAVPGLEPPRPRRRGFILTRCDAVGVRSLGARVGLRVRGNLRRLDAGRPLRLLTCEGDPELSLPAGASHLSVPPGRVFRADHLRLRSLPPRGTGRGVGVDPPAVLPGPGGRAPDRHDLRLAPAGGGWLVLAESYSSGWRATCSNATGEQRSLGVPMPIDGYANGWRIGPGCVRASLVFAPQRLANAAYAVSAVTCLALLGLLLWFRRSSARRSSGAQPVQTPPVRLDAVADPLLQPSWPRMLLLAVALAAVSGVGFALRVAPFVLLGAVALMRAGVSVRRLGGLAALAFLAIPLLYTADPAPDLGGFSFGYAPHHIRGHWAAVAGLCLLGPAAVLAALAVRRARSDTQTSPQPEGGADEPVGEPAFAAR